MEPSIETVKSEKKRLNTVVRKTAIENKSVKISSGLVRDLQAKSPNSKLIFNGSQKMIEGLLKCSEKHTIFGT